jgi:hypothetical protein
MVTASGATDETACEGSSTATTSGAAASGSAAGAGFDAFLVDFEEGLDFEGVFCAFGGVDLTTAMFTFIHY